MRVKSTSGRLSDLAQLGHRADWSVLNEKLKTIQPGEMLVVSCPKEVTVKSLRSTILTNGKRFHSGQWVLSTRTKGKSIYCFLVPTT